jgi:hypothetical protein
MPVHRKKVRRLTLPVAMAIKIAAHRDSDRSCRMARKLLAADAPDLLERDPLPPVAPTGLTHTEAVRHYHCFHAGHPA